MKIVRILSIDGGGIKGIIPATILAEIYRRLSLKGVKLPFHQIFNLMAGTSTGGLICLALSMRDAKTPHEIIVLYHELGQIIFPGAKKKTFKTIKQIFSPKYSPKPLNNFLTNFFGDTTLNDAMTNLLITSFDMIRMTPLFFKKRPSWVSHNSDENFYFTDIALATSAVPTYFPPAIVKPFDIISKTYCLIDGGVFCINPALSAYIEARKIYPEAEKYIILSLGTGYHPFRVNNYKKISGWGFYEWIAPWNHLPLLSSIEEGQKISSNHMLNKLSNVELHRYDISLDNGKGGMDDGSASNIQYLQQKASTIIRKNHKDIDLLCEKLV